MFKYTNNNDISLALAVFLMYDTYDHDDRPNSISATTLMKPIRQLVLMQQNKELRKVVDISDLVPSRMGSAIHDGCEQAWTDEENVAAALKVLGASEDSIKKVRINPRTYTEGEIPVYVEQRSEREFGIYIVVGKFDLVLHGTLNDYKSTSVWTHIYDSNALNYKIQGSIYKWLNPDKITSDYININYIFTDWSATKAKQDPKYPQLRILTKKYPLMSNEETEHWITQKLDKLTFFINSPQEMLPECNDEELWASSTVYKYFKKPGAARSTKNFDNMDEALIFKTSCGDIGEIITVPGEVKACRYCPVANVCTQAEGLLASGRLVL